MQDARSVASASIAKTFKRFPELDPSSIDAGDLEPRDASLARAIDHSVRRRWLTLAAMIEHASNRPFVTLEPTVGASLLVGTSQLLLFDRLPDHAIIDCAVEWTRHGGKRPRATGFVNAVLRKVVKLRGSLEETGELGNEKHLPRSDGSWWHLTEDVFKSVAPQVGFSKKVWARIEKQLGAQIAQTFALNAIAEPPLIVTGETLPQSVTPHETPKFGVLPSGVEIQPFLKESPQLHVQDPTSGVSLTLLRSIEQTPHRILDLCAGRGTKTRQLRSMFPNAMIGATEPNDARRASLQEIAKEFDVTVYAPNKEGPTEPFDLVVADVPCSNSGVFARRPEAKYRYDEKHITSLVELQQTIIRDGVAVLNPNGHFLYATCSIDREENGSQIAWMQSKRKLSLVDQSATLPSGAPTSDPATWHDGGFAALLQRKA
jgi:16S rRNA (cytosine967-C5)-methyltransferase